MILSRKQKMLLHTMAAHAGVTEAERRIVQRNVGGFHSAADSTATREGFIAVMAFYEARSNGQLPGFTARYWQGENERANPTDRIIWRIRSEGRAMGLSDNQLDRFMAGPHMSRGAYACLADAPAWWLQKLLQALLEIRRRKSRSRA